MRAVQMSFLAPYEACSHEAVPGSFLHGSHLKSMPCLPCVLHASSSRVHIFSLAFKSEIQCLWERKYSRKCIRDAWKGEVWRRHFSTKLMHVEAWSTVSTACFHLWPQCHDSSMHHAGQLRSLELSSPDKCLGLAWMTCNKQKISGHIYILKQPLEDRPLLRLVMQQRLPISTSSLGIANER